MNRPMISQLLTPPCKQLSVRIKGVWNLFLEQVQRVVTTGALAKLFPTPELAEQEEQLRLLTPYC